jgi:hypothetical protein
MQIWEGAFNQLKHSIEDPDINSTGHFIIHRV